MRLLLLFSLLALVACNGDIFTRDGVTDGDTFYLAPTAFTNDDPAFQSWVAYSLMKSTCQLEMGGENPARQSSFGCECIARRHLVQTWIEKAAAGEVTPDRYLDDLQRVSKAGFLEEYIASFFARSNWELPDGLRMAEFRDWRRANLRRHRPVTRIIGSWAFAGGAAKG